MAASKPPVKPKGLFRNDNPVVKDQARQGQRKIVPSHPVYGGFIRHVSALPQPNERFPFESLHHSVGRKRRWW